MTHKNSRKGSFTTESLAISASHCQLADVRTHIQADRHFTVNQAPTIRYLPASYTLASYSPVLLGHFAAGQFQSVVINPNEFMNHCLVSPLCK